VTELLVFALDPLGSPKRVDRTMLRGGHEPGARVVRNARLGPLLERGKERVLREVFSETDIAHYPGKSCYQLRGFDSPDCIDRAMGVGGRHDLQSHQLRALVQGPKTRRYALAGAFPRGF